MSYPSILSLIAGFLQLVVAAYALRLNRLFGTARVGWSLFSAFALLAILHLIQTVPSFHSGLELGVKIKVVYALISMLLLTGMVHMETLLKERLRLEREEQRLRSELEVRIREKTVDLIKANEVLQGEIEERKRMQLQVEQSHKELLTASHRAAMAEIATSVLHNVGNVLNSVNVSASLVSDQVKQSKIAKVVRVGDLMREHAADMGDFLTRDPKGQMLPVYISQLAEHLANEQTALLKEMESLRKNIEHIKDIVAIQQNYAKLAGMAEIVKVTELVEDALRMNAISLAKHDVQVVREYDAAPPEIIVEKHKVLQILVNLVRNAKYSCEESNQKDKRLTLRVTNGADRVSISVIDNGIGIAQENLPRIFNHGFTTRKDGHGFGLHNGAQIAKELGGVLLVHSDGPGAGACFTLELPRQAKLPAA